VNILRQIKKGRLALCLALVGACAGGVILAHNQTVNAVTYKPASTTLPALSLSAATGKHNPYGLKYRTTAAAAESGGKTDADAVYFPTEKGRHVVCLVRGLSYWGAVMSCDWDGYHARYGPGDPFDQR
jgi:hypothetical protein